MRGSRVGIHPFRLLLGLTLACLVTGTARGDPPGGKPPPISASVRPRAPEAANDETQALERQLADGQARFALELRARLASQPGNLLFSPWSIHSALSMARGGARGATAEEMDAVLHLPAGGGVEGWAGLVARLSGAPASSDRAGTRGGALPRVSLSSANALYAQQGSDVRPAFRDLVREAFGGRIEEVDFVGDSDAARRRINAWVSERTRERIAELLAPGTVNAQTLLVLVNALHLEAPWERAFEREETQPADFFAADGTTRRVEMMRTERTLRLYDDEEVLAVALPFAGGSAELLLVLPRDAAGLKRLEEGLAPETIDRWVRRGTRRPVRLHLPRLKIETSMLLGGMLRALGMTRAFDRQQADFGGLAEPVAPGLWLDDVVHQAFLTLNEKGAEAAAATATVATRGGGDGFDSEPEPFVCERPFLFFLRQVETGVLLFVGRYSQPAEAPR